MKNLTQAYLKKILKYHRNGTFTWRVKQSNCVNIGDVAGTFNKSTGYFCCKIDYTQYRLHRLVWLYHKGEFPPMFLDHKDRDKTNNRIGNLRPATCSQNAFNMNLGSSNTSGYKGVCWDNDRKRWLVTIVINGKTLFKKRFKIKKDAIKAREEAAKKYHKEFYHDGQGK